MDRRWHERGENKMQWKKRYDCWQQDVYGSFGLRRLNNNSIYLHSPSQIWGKAIGWDVALRSFKVIQGHRNWYQSQARMRFSISLPLKICGCLRSFPRHNDCRPSLVWSPGKGCSSVTYSEKFGLKTLRPEYPVVKLARPYVHWFWLNTSVWQTQRQIDGHAAHTDVAHVQSRRATETGMGISLEHERDWGDDGRQWVRCVNTIGHNWPVFFSP